VIGPDYIDIAYEAAREADPSAILIYEDTENHFSAGITTQLTRETIRRLKGKNLVDGVGLEMHMRQFGNQVPTKADVTKTMQSYKLPVYVTEFDVTLKGVTGSQAQRFARQAQIYKDMFEACLESGVCKSFLFWGISDKYSWLENQASSGESYSTDADATMFDDDLNPKPAYFTIRDVLMQYAQK
jgi:endo-1,4-beta-xylanase